jgi:transposase-like protein
MSKQRSRYSTQFKFQLALEAAKGLKTINELASEHGVHPTIRSASGNAACWREPARFSAAMVLTPNASTKNGRWNSTSKSAGSKWNWSG